MLFINKIIRWFANKPIQQAFLDGYRKAKDEYSEERKRSAAFEVEELLNKPVFSHPNEWQDPVIGVCVDVYYTTQTTGPIPIIKNYLTGETFPCYNTVRVLTWQKLKPILYLDPFERWVLLSDRYSDNPYVKVKGDTNALTGIELENILEETGFLKLLKDHPTYIKKES